MQTHQRHAASLAILLSSLFLSALSLQAQTLPVLDPNHVLTAKEREIVDETIAQIPGYRLTGLAGVKVSASDDVSWYQFDGQYLNVHVAGTGAERDADPIPFPWGRILIQGGVASKDLYRMYYDHSDRRDEFMSWIQVFSPAADYSGPWLSSTFRYLHEDWYPGFLQDPVIGSRFDARLQQRIFMGALQAHDGESLYFTFDGTSSADYGRRALKHTVRFLLKKNALVIGDYLLMMKDGAVTDIWNGNEHLFTGLNVALAESTMAMIRESGSVSDDVEPQPVAPPNAPKPRRPYPWPRPPAPTPVPVPRPFGVAPGITSRQTAVPAAAVTSNQAPSRSYVPLTSEEGQRRLRQLESPHDVTVIKRDRR